MANLAQAAADQDKTTPDEQGNAVPPSLAPQILMSAEGDTALPDQVAYLPIANPAAKFPIAVPAGQQTPAAPAVASNTAIKPQAGAPAATPTEKPVIAAETASAQADATKSDPVAAHAVYVTSGEMPAKPAEDAKPKSKGFFASLFGSSSSSDKAAHDKKEESEPASPKPIITLASAKQEVKPVTASVSGFSGDALPGVRRQTALFEINRKSGIDDDSDIDINEDEGAGLYQLASAAGMARIGPNGFLKQTEDVDVSCLKPSLVRMLKKIEAHYGKKMIVTSGYRDRARNRRARGARRSLHMFCAAADIQVPGVSKWELASYVRSMPGRGGVGTYCHTKSIHVDVGPERDWNWRCRRRK